MKEKIKSTSVSKDGEEIVYTLEDKDYLLITAINNLTTQLKILGNKFGR